MATTPTPGGSRYGAALYATSKRLGYVLNEVESTPGLQVTTPLSPFVGSNADRVGLLISNFGPNNIYISLGSTPVATAALLLTAGGGTITMDVRDDFTLPTRAWFGVSPAGAQLIYVLELIAIAPFETGVIP